MDLSVNYLGLDLKNPLMVSASPLTSKLDNIKIFEDHGIAAVVLRSLFEEEIYADLEEQLSHEDMYFWYPEAAEHVRKLSKRQVTSPYLKLIEQAKAATDIPIIASVNCFTSGSWVKFARNIQEAGADALELNVSTQIPHDEILKDDKIEKNLHKLVNSVKNELDIPVAVKIGHFYTNLVGTGKMLESSGADGLIIFNRYYRPDIDIENLEVISDNNLSTPSELTLSLRWVAILSKYLDLDLAASTGIHTYEGVVKQILAGAKVAQICSILYLAGFREISLILEELMEWMDRKRFNSIDEFRGKITDSRLNSIQFEKLQFIKKTHKAPPEIS